MIFHYSPDMAQNSNKKYYFSYFSIKSYTGEALLMSTHNICFCGQIRKKIVHISLFLICAMGKLKLFIIFCADGQILFATSLISFLSMLNDIEQYMGIVLCCGFTARSIQWCHVERS